MARFKVGQLLDAALTEREQANVLNRMRRLLLDEEAKARDQRRVTQRQASADRKARTAALGPEGMARQRVAQLRRLDRGAATLEPVAGLVPAQEYGGHPDATARARDQLDRLEQEQHTATREARGLTTDSADQIARAGAMVAHHFGGRAGYWEITGPSPVCQPGETDKAMLFYRRVLSAIDRGGWTHSERSALYELERRWRPRALGEDPRFMLAGTQSGRLPRDVERRIRAWTQAHKGGG